MEKLLKIVFLQCLLLLPCVLSNSEFFNHGPLHGDNSFTRTAMNDGILSLFKDIAISCASVRQLRVFANGRATLSPRVSSTVFLDFHVFKVDEGEVDARNVSYRYVNIATAERVCMTQYYDTFFPRERLSIPFVPTDILVVTWKITQDIMSSTMGNVNNNTFQLIMAVEGNRSMILYLYDTIEWGADSATVNIRTCNAAWQPPPSAGETVRDGSNIGTRKGEWLFYVPADGRILPSVVCSTGCSLVNGYCTVKDTCLCRPNWSGANCENPVCPSGCVNGNCNAPETCTCNTGWEGVDCNTAECNEECLFGGCQLPYNCTCLSGWGGQYCTVAICNEGCGSFGFCTRPNFCSCISGYGGSTCAPLCSICNDNCNNGNCTDPDTCTCATGWLGNCCNITVSITTSPPPTPTVDTGSTSSSLSGSTIGAIAGGIAGLAFIIIVIVVIFVIAFVSC